jgi:hypothetical protein
MKMDALLCKVWESYGHHGNECTIWWTKEAAESHGLYSIDFASEAIVALSENERIEMNSGKVVWAD